MHRGRFQVRTSGGYAHGCSDGWAPGEPADRDPAHPSRAAPWAKAARLVGEDPNRWAAADRDQEPGSSAPAGELPNCIVAFIAIKRIAAKLILEQFLGTGD